MLRNIYVFSIHFKWTKKLRGNCFFYSNFQQFENIFYYNIQHTRAPSSYMLYTKSLVSVCFSDTYFGVERLTTGEGREMNTHWRMFLNPVDSSSLLWVTIISWWCLMPLFRRSCSTLSTPSLSRNAAGDDLTETSGQYPAFLTNMWYFRQGVAVSPAAFVDTKVF